MDTVGGFAGPLAAIGLMLWFAGDIRSALWFAVIPGGIAVLILLFAVTESDAPRTGRAPRLPFTREGFNALGSAYWRIVAVGGLLMLARATEAFLVLRASSLGLSDTWVPAVMVVMSLAFTLIAWPAGAWSDRRDRRVVLAAGLILLVVADCVLATASGIPALMIGVAIWGLHMGLTQGVLTAMIADRAPGALRGTAFGVFNLASGVCLLIAGAVAGLWWDGMGPSAPFWFGAAVAVLCLPLVVWLPGAPDGRT
jgi:MFS family permease